MQKKILAMVFAAMMMAGSLPIKSSPQWDYCVVIDLSCGSWSDHHFSAMVCGDSYWERRSMMYMWLHIECATAQDLLN